MSYDQDRDVCSHCGDPINCEGHCERAIRRQEASNAFNAAVERMRAEGSYLYPFDGRKSDTTVEQDEPLNEWGDLCERMALAQVMGQKLSRWEEYT